MMKFLKRLWLSTNAATAVEFALVGPFAIIILTAGMDIGYSIFLKAELNDALIEAARWEGAGLITLTGDRWNDVIANIQNRTGLTPSVYATAYPGTSVGTGAVTLPTNFSTVCGTGGSDDSAGTIGAAGDVVVFCAELTDPIFGLKMDRNEPTWFTMNFTIAATTIVRNEPF
jgi:Flp pilus assembly protein TadG